MKHFADSITRDGGPGSGPQGRGSAKEASAKASLARVAASRMGPNDPGKADAHQEAAKLSRVAAMAHKKDNNVQEMYAESDHAKTQERLERENRKQSW